MTKEYSMEFTKEDTLLDRIAELEEEQKKNNGLSDNLTQAKSLLRELYSIIKVECSPFTREEHKNILSEAEEFLTKEREIYD